MSQQELSQRIGIAQSDISKLKNGKARIWRKCRSCFVENSKLRESDEREICFCFHLPWDTDQEQIYEFVKLLRREGFYCG